MYRSKTAPDLFEESKKAKSSPSIKANYGPLRQRLLKLAPLTYHCRLFCGGLKCKYCNPDYMPKDQQAIDGLYSTWITDNILATSRPTTSGIAKYSMFESFHQNGIKSVINLQRVLEHQECGPPLDKSGFSYDPEEFMRNKIFHYNFGWPDFGVASLSALLDMVKVFHFALSQGKVAVHCHAGLGRTGVLICGFLMWSRDLTDIQAVEYVRCKRPSSVQTVEQVHLVEQFCSLLKTLKPVFRSDLTFEDYLQQQRLTLHGSEARVLKFVPKIVFIVCERLSELFGVNAPDTLSKKLKDLACHNYNENDKTLKSRGSLPVSIQQFYANLDDEPKLLLPARKNSGPMISGASSNFKSAKLPPLPSGGNSTSTVAWNALPKISDKKVDRIEKRERRQINSLSVDTAQFFTKAQNSDLKTYKTAQSYKENLNTGNFLTRWDNLVKEEDPFVLFVLMMDWFHSLKASIIAVEDIDRGKNEKGVIKNCKWTIWYTARLFQILCQDESNPVREASRLMAEMFCWTRTNENVNNFMQLMIENVNNLFQD